MNVTTDGPQISKPEISRFAFAMFDVLGFSRWLESAGLQAVLDSYHLLIERVVVRPNEKGGLGAVQTREGAIFVITGPPGYTYFSDTILLWHPLVPAFVDDFVTRCSELICDALAMGIPLRGAITLGDAVLSRDSDFFIGTPIVEAARLEKSQNWIGLRSVIRRCGHPSWRRSTERRSLSIHHQRRTRQAWRMPFGEAP